MSEPIAHAPSSPTRRRARRGDGLRLRDEILQATSRLVAESGDWRKVSIAAIANAVGCSQPAIYLHFADKHALIMAVYEEHFEQFRVALLEAQATADDPLEALVARGRTYISWGLTHPDAYRILFMHDRESVEVERSTQASFTDQVDAVNRCIEAGYFPGGDPHAVACALWISTHGLVSLQLAKPDFSWPDPDTLFRLAVTDHGLGIATDLESQ